MAVVELVVAAAVVATAAEVEKGGGERERFIEKEVVDIVKRNLPAYNIVGGVYELGFWGKGRIF